MIVHTAASKAVGPSSGGQQVETGTNLMVTMITTAETIVISGACKCLCYHV
jgi:hypothetical protein